MPSQLRSCAKSVLCRCPAVYRWAKRAYGWTTYRLGVPHESDFAFFRNLDGGGLFVDVGANAGQSARSLRIFNRQLQILSFEPNRLLESELRFTKRLLGAGYDYRMIGLGSQPGKLTLYVPMAGATPLTPWATADRDALDVRRAEIEHEAGSTFTVAEVPVEICRFDDLDLHPRVVKMDVEGFELEVLRGMRETLERDEPILMIERNSGAEAIAAWLGELGYRTFEYQVDTNTLAETGDLCGTINFFACTSAVVEQLRAEDEVRIREAAAAIEAPAVGSTA